MRTLILSFFLGLTTCFYAIPNGNETAFEMNSRLGRGINIGNTFEAPSETAWSNPWKHDYARIISELGFDHIRVPVRWEPRSMEESPYTIDPEFFERIQSVIDTALKYQLHVIINMHHHEALLNDPEGEKERFLSQWEQIADYFRDYPDSLLFEVFNEPHGDITPEKWNIFFAEALSRIRTSNPERFVLLGTANWGGIGGLQHLEVPDDPNLIVTVHYYSPFQFTHQGASWVGGNADDWLGTRWYGTDAEREAVENDFRAAVQFGEQHNVPIHVGEFGAYSTADMESRARWTTFVSRHFEQLGFSWAYWEFSAGFGIYDRNSGQLRPELVDALLLATPGEPTETIRDTIYASDFTASNDGWSLNTSGGASAELVRESGELKVNISDGGINGWNVQLVKSNVLLEKGKSYRVAFKASSSQGRSTSTYIGRASSPWGSYSGYHGKVIGSEIFEYSYTFKMTSDTDQSSRLVVDLGGNTADFILHEYTLEETTIVIPWALNITAENGSVIIDPEAEVFMGGETYTLTAVPDEGYVFVGWSGDATGSANPIDVYIYSDNDITAVFAALYTLNVNAENGSVTVDPVKDEYQDGETVTLTAVPDEGFLFEGWSGDGSGDENPIDITMNSDKDITAIFSEIPVTHTLSVVAENGSVTVDPEQDEYIEGETVTLTAIPDDGFFFEGWSGDATGDVNPLVLIMDADKDIVASFEVETGLDKTGFPGTKVNIFPNPLRTGYLTIKSQVRSDIAIYSITGNMLMKFDSVHEVQIDRSRFKTGVYLIKVTGEGAVKTHLFVVE